MGIHALHDDFMRVKDILGALMPRVRTTIGRFSPLLDVIDRVGGADDDEVLNFGLLRRAVDLVAATESDDVVEVIDALDHVAPGSP